MYQKSDCLLADLRIMLFAAVAGMTLQANAGSADGNNGARPEMRPLGNDLPAAPDAPQAAQATGALSLRQALELAIAHNPQLAASSHQVLAAEGNARQAGALANPELEVEAEEFGGSGTREGFDSAEMTVRISQLVELGGKRGKRQRMAQSEARLAGWEYEAKRLDVITETKKAFVDVLLAQGKLALAESMLVLAVDVQKSAAERVKAGKVPVLEETKAAVEVANARIARDRAVRELATVRKRLSASWGETAPVFTDALGNLDAVGDVPSMDKLSALLVEMPEVARWDEEVVLAGMSLALARAERVPSVEVSAGMTSFEEDGTRAASVGLSIPLPLFDRNSGGVAAAKHQASRTAYEQRAAGLRAITDLAEAYSSLETARAEALTIREDLLPGAQQAFDSAQTGYREGKYGHLDVLDTQRTLGEAKVRYLEVLADYHKAAADVERLTGTPLNTL